MLVFPVFWIFIVFLIAYIGGWRRLAEHYSQIIYPKSGDTKVVRFASGRIGLSNYNGVLTLTFSRAGLFLDMIIFFKFGHKDLFIPWTEIIQIAQKKVMFFNYYEILLKKTDAKILIHKRHFEKGLDYVPKNLIRDSVYNVS